MDDAIDDGKLCQINLSVRECGQVVCQLQFDSASLSARDRKPLSARLDFLLIRKRRRADNRVHNDIVHPMAADNRREGK